MSAYVDTSKHATSLLVLDYFKVLGLHDAYNALVRESGMAEIVGPENSHLKERFEITQHVLAGEVRQAVSKLADLDSTLIRSIGFHLQKQALLEIIKKGNSAPEALKYAQVQVAPMAKDHPDFAAELENIMSLLLYSNLADSPDNHFISDDQRLKTASIANTALLRYSKHSERPKLEMIMKSIFWAQDVASKAGIVVPRLLDLRSITFESDEDGEIFMDQDNKSDEEGDDDDGEGADEDEEEEEEEPFAYDDPEEEEEVEDAGAEEEA